MTKHAPEGHKHMMDVISMARGLKPSEKLVLFCLARFADWRTADRITASVSRMAAECGLSDRTVGRCLRSLEEKGSIRFDRRSKGGRWGFECGATHLIRLNLDQIAALGNQHDTDPHKPFSLKLSSGPSESHRPDGPSPKHGCADGLSASAEDISNQLRHLCQSTPKSAPINSDTGDNQPRHSFGQPIQPPIQNTTTSTTACDGVRQGGAIHVQTRGGGGGESQRLDPIPSDDGQGPSREPSKSRSMHDSAESEALLAARGISAKKARSLAPLHTPEEIRWAIDYVATKAPNAKSRQGLLVTLVEDGTALREVEKQRRDVHERRRRALLRMRDALAQIASTEATPGDCRQQVRFLAETWGGTTGIANAQLVPDDRLIAAHADPLPVLREMVDETKRRLEVRACA